MTKTEYCHRITELNEAIYDTENEIASIESKLRWDDESRREWYLKKLAESKSELENLKKRLEVFTREHHYKFFP